MDPWTEYLWIVIVGAFTAFFMAYGIGANDVANAFATSVGSKTLTLFQAVITAGIFEFLGALLLGRGVTDTIKSGIVDQSEFVETPEVFMYGMFCALMASALWLIIATSMELPVSTTHSIFGGVIGMGLVAYGSEAVKWHDIDKTAKFPIKGVSAVVISWVVSPVMSGFVGAGFFLFARTFILRSEDSYNRTFWFLPGLVCICTFINAFYVLDKGINKQWAYLKDRTDRSALWAAITTLVVGFFSIFWTMILKKRLQLKADAETARIKALEAEEVSDSLELRIPSVVASAEIGVQAEPGQELEGQEHQVQEQQQKGSTEEGGSEAPSKDGIAGWFSKLSKAINDNDPHSAVDQDVNVYSIHDNAEQFEEKTEAIFRYLQVLTACCDSFAHGANDVANSIGPFSAMWAVYRDQDIGKKSEVPVWILLIGGVGIVIGLATYGYKIIQAIGVKLAKITPSRGFSIELGSALVVVTGSYFELPLSTTHCQVGATAAVGLLEGTGGVSWNIMGRTVVGWVMTLVVVGTLSAILMAMGIYSPNLSASKAIANIRNNVNNVSMVATDLLESECVGDALVDAELLDARGFFQETTEENYKYPLRIADAISYMGNLSTSLASPMPCSITPVSEAFPISLQPEFDFEEEEEEERRRRSV